ncbi:hypothetical protein QTG54_012407 [Skeletonema marinoi]|uniref:TLC domain-containing protein n=1 Tax=Skeletonema marinoi TaxID=267567 RepID=A0AAD9D7L5_9STRA|nr:hypothetical protein QTG54_012407 [Skeletonema marinoi]
MIPLPTFEQLSTVPSMATTALLFAIFWTVSLPLAEKKIALKLTDAAWWPGAVSPTKSMMYNFGYPKEPTKRFPDGVTESLARDFYSGTISICVAHALCATPMVPVLIRGWEDSSDFIKVSFVLGTLADLGFDIYDAVQLSIRAFAKNHSKPIPIEFWVILVCMHHTTALLLVMPLNLHYVHRFEYHQTAVSLLYAASACYLAGAYKFTLNVYEKRKDFVLYKIIVFFQLAVLLYTRVYLWFPAAFGLRAHMKEQNDTTFFYGATVMVTIFSIFNLVLIVDGLGAAAKWLPRKFPKSKEEKGETAALVRRTSATGIVAPALQMLRAYEAKRKFRAGVKLVIATNRLSSHASSISNNKKED